MSVEYLLACLPIKDHTAYTRHQRLMTKAVGISLRIFIQNTNFCKKHLRTNETLFVVVNSLRVAHYTSRDIWLCRCLIKQLCLYRITRINAI